MREMGLNFGEVARLIVSAFAQQIFRAGFVHSDPHPGNVLVRKGADGHAEIVVRSTYHECQASVLAELC